MIEHLFGWMKEKRRLCTRYGKLAKSYHAMVMLAGYLRACNALIDAQ
ncbi:transposase [Modicisalibacter luteus]|uniref:Transposase n=1 Tax=Modicisalibacter luteus TaxID=453962 RepID=A0ABV7M226_9GAMM|nr:transposase [Halomonas lutea]GHB14678.1 hypothetical protein GCM10007159_41340 [Halomonas lutea]